MPCRTAGPSVRVSSNQSCEPDRSAPERLTMDSKDGKRRRSNVGQACVVSRVHTTKIDQS